MPPNNKAIISSNSGRLDELPSDTLGIILARLPIQDAVRTSILSRSWRSRWCSMPDLFFAFNSDTSKWSIIVSNILLQYSGDINKFSIVIPLPHRDDGVFQNIHVWIKNLVSRHVQELTLMFQRYNGTSLADRYLLPSYLFSCDHLTKLMLENCVLKPPLNSVGLKKLRVLQLFNVSLPGDTDFEQFISSCSSLQVLQSRYIDGPTCLNISAPNLKKLYVLNTCGSIKMVKIERCVLVEELTLDLRYFGTDLMRDMSGLTFLRRLKFGGYPPSSVYDEGKPPVVPGGCLSGLHRLAELEVVCGYTKHKVMVANILQLASVLPNLRCLRLNIFDVLSQEYNHQLPLKQYFMDDKVSYTRLCNVFLQNVRGSAAEMEVIKFLLVNCPSLELMDLKLRRRYASYDEVILNRLKPLPRSSLNVEFKVHA